MGDRHPKQVWAASNLIQRLGMKVEKELSLEKTKMQEGESQQHSATKNGMSEGCLKRIHTDDAKGLILLTLLT